jgi:N-dimethylarginine dimethylaminohydrolase
MNVGSADTVPSEATTRPAAIVVHNPVAWAFRAFDEFCDDSRLEPELLFRARPDAALYDAQHRFLATTIAALGGCVVHLSQLVGKESWFADAASNPNQVFTRDSLITLPWAPEAYFRARMKPPQRRGEAHTMQNAVERLGLRELMRLPDNIFLEGGDVIPFACQGRRCLLVGHGPRSSPAAVDFLQQTLLPDQADEIIAIELAPWRMNLDGGFVPVADDVIVSDRSSILGVKRIDAHGATPLALWDMLQDLGIAVIDTTPHESVHAQSCNCLCLGDRSIICYDLCPRVAALLKRHDIRVHLVPGSELIKGRGGPRCMSRPIYLAGAVASGIPMAAGV